MGNSDNLLIRDRFSSHLFDPAELKSVYERERDKRIRAIDRAPNDPVPVDMIDKYSRDPWVAPGFTREPINDHTEVIIIGGGFGGLLLAGRLHNAGFRDVRIIEQAGDFGGTWYWNRYPGAMCDIESFVYMPLLEELKYAPKHKYAYAEELLDLSQTIGRHYGLYDKACFQTSVTEARWIQDQQKWSVKTDRGDRMTADYFMLACGRQTLPEFPSIPGVGSFRGRMFHTSRWDYDYTGGSEDGELMGLADKRVAVIGTGATAIQVVPEVGKWAKKLFVFQRTPSAVGVRGQKELPPDYVDLTSVGWQKRRRENFQNLWTYRPEEVDYVNDGWTDLIAKIRPLAPDELVARLGRPPEGNENELAAEIPDYEVMNGLRRRVEETVADKATAEALKPWYRWWCKRPCFHDDYLAAFNRDNVELVDTQGQGVRAFTETGVVVGDKEYEVDCVVLATGFDLDTNFISLAGFEIYGRDNVRWSDHWRSGVRTLHGVCTDGFPNCFIVGSYEHTASSGNVGHLLDEEASHVAYIVEQARKRGYGPIEPSKSAVDEYTDLIKKIPANRTLQAFLNECTPGYFNRGGKASRNDELFFGNRFRDAISYYKFLEEWRNNGEMKGLVSLPINSSASPG